MLCVFWCILSFNCEGLGQQQLHQVGALHVLGHGGVRTLVWYWGGVADVFVSQEAGVPLKPDPFLLFIICISCDL